MPHPRSARPAPDPEDDDDPRTDAALRAELQRRLDHLRWAFGYPLTDDPEPAGDGPDLT